MLDIKLYRRSSPLVPLCRHLLGLPACWLCDSNILTFFFRTAAMSTPDQCFSQIFIHFIFLWMQYFPKFLKDPKVSENYLAVLFYQNCHLLYEVSIMPKRVGMSQLLQHLLKLGVKSDIPISIQNLIFQATGMPGQVSISVCWLVFAEFEEYVSRFIGSTGKKSQPPFVRHVTLNNSGRYICIFFKFLFYT